ncbi:hypothetical protein DSO57_1024584 [Entomophthora muscae]|uniref:Uncharacterized protein n=1 Tax=Entomophthora muscae TaxID=34485 RepID=A0ACC2TPQ7_9FUNG|nr:hypothetical protein DSO57_1024584 [Entomophthora muscae]
MVLTCASAAGPLTHSKRAKAPIAPGFMELPTKKVASKKQAKASVCPPMLTTPLLALPLCLCLLLCPRLALPLVWALLWFPLLACFLGLSLLGLWPCLPLCWQSLPPGCILPLGFLSPIGVVSPWALLPLGGGVPWFPPRVLAYTGEGLDPLVAYVHEDLVPEILLPQEVVFHKQDIARAYRLIKNLTNRDLLALVAIASQVASS